MNVVAIAVLRRTVLRLAVLPLVALPLLGCDGGGDASPTGGTDFAKARRQRFEDLKAKANATKGKRVRP
jgi:hypothetical protein